MADILIIEDDRKINELIRRTLSMTGHQGLTAFSGQEALSALERKGADLILLDIGLPDMDGFSLMRQLRAEYRDIPVICVTARDEVPDRVRGLKDGAEDYIVKPFAMEELLARIRSISRRPRQWEKEPSLCIRDITYSPGDNQLSGALGSCSLSKKEGMLLEVFLLNPEQVLPRDTLLSRVWGVDAEVEDGNLDNYIHFIRRRLKTVDRKSVV